MRVTTRRELHEALDQALHLDRPVVINAVADAPAVSGPEGAVAPPVWLPS
jgi:thiamine pyrophosphate-dependent acetolactate synthase large subunit-like protein